MELLAVDGGISFAAVFGLPAILLALVGFVTVAGLGIRARTGTFTPAKATVVAVAATAGLVTTATTVAWLPPVEAGIVAFGALSSFPLGAAVGSRTRAGGVGATGLVVASGVVMGVQFPNTVGEVAAVAAVGALPFLALGHRLARPADRQT